MTIDDISAALGTTSAALSAALAYASLSGSRARVNAELETLVASKAAAMAQFDSQIMAKNVELASADAALRSGIVAPSS